MQKWTRLLVILATCLLMLILAGIAVEFAARMCGTLLLFSLGAMVAYALNPVVEFVRMFGTRTRQPRLSHGLGVVIVFVGLTLIGVLSAWSLEGKFVDQIAAIQHDYPQYQQRALAMAAAADLRLKDHGMHISLTRAIESPPPQVKRWLTGLGQQLLPFVGYVFGNVAESLLVLLIALYLLLYSAQMREKFNALLPAEGRRRVDAWEGDVSIILGRFVRGQIVIGVVMGVAAGFFCLLLGIHLWLIIGIVVGVSSLIPVFGPYIGAVPAVIAVLVGPTRLHNPAVDAALVVIFFVVINEVSSKILYPKLVGAALGLHSVFVLFVLFAGLEMGGIVGVLFAPVLAALAIATAVHLYRFWQDLPDDLRSIRGPEDKVSPSND